MSSKLNITIDGTCRESEKAYITINGVFHEVAEMYQTINGVHHAVISEVKIGWFHLEWLEPNGDIMGDEHSFYLGDTWETYVQGGFAESYISIVGGLVYDNGKQLYYADGKPVYATDLIIHDYGYRDFIL